MLTLPRVGTISAQRAAAYGAAALWIWTCASQLLHVVDKPTALHIGVYALLALLPFILLNISKVPIYLLAVYSAMVPFTQLLETGAGGTLTKYIGALAGTLLLLSAARTGKIIPISRATVILLVFSAYLGATIFWSIDPAQSLTTYGIYLSYIFLFLAIAFSPVSRNEVALIVCATIAGGVIASAFGGYLFLHGREVSGGRLSIGYNAEHSIDANEYAVALLTSISVALVLYLRSKAWPAKVAWFSVLSVLFYGFIISGSRGALFGLCAVVGVLLARPQYRRAIVTLFSVSLIFVMVSPIGMRILWPDIGNGDLRTEIWKIGFASLHQYWLYGAGIGNFQLAYTEYFLRTPHMPLMWARPAHSIVVGAAVELGLIGFALFIAMWFQQYNELRRPAKLDDLLGDVALALRAGVAGLFVSGLSLDLMLTKYTWMTFALIALVRSASLQRDAESPISDTAGIANKPRSWRLIAPREV